jgi:hypothetical protein
MTLMPTQTKILAGRLRQRIAITADDSGTLPSEIELLQTGMWDAPYHGMFMVTSDDLREYVQNFADDVRPSSSTAGLPIDAEHDTDGGAYGWIKSLSVKPNDQGGESLWGHVEWTDLGKQALTGGVYKFFSPEFCPDGYMDPEGFSDDCDNVLLGGGLTNRPLFKNLTPVMASDGTQGATDDKKIFISIKERSMPTLDEIRVKEASDLTAEDKQVLTDHKSELSADELTKFDLKADETAEDKTEVVADKPVVAEPVAASDKGNVTISAGELAALKDQAAQGVLANQKLVTAAATDEINQLAFSASEGVKFAMDQKTDVVAFYLSCNDAQKEAFTKLVKAMPAHVSAGDMTATGSGADAMNNGEAYSQLKQAADKLVADGKAKTFSQALVMATDQNPDLAKAQTAETSVK